MELAKKELAEIGLATADDVKDGCVVRQKKAYPVYDDNYKENVETIRADLAEKLSDAAPRRPQRHAQVQQPGSRDDDVDADGQEHHRRREPVRHLERQRGRRIPRSGRFRLAGSAEERAHGAGADQGRQLRKRPRKQFAKPVSFA